MSEQPKPKAERRHLCAYCGDDMGVYDRRHCDAGDTCGKQECERWARDRDKAQSEREEADDQLDRDLGYGGR